MARRFSFIIFFFYVQNIYSYATLNFYQDYNIDQEFLAKVGEWVYGHNIIINHIINKKNNVSEPITLIFDVQDNIDYIIKSLKKYPNTNFAVKYSLYNNKSFSYQGLRGANSSRNRKVNSDSIDIASKIKIFFRNVPQSVKKIVFQELINQSNGFLFHAEFNHDIIELDALWENSTARAYMSFSNNKVQKFETIPGLFITENINLSLKLLSKDIKKIENLLSILHFNITWSIEGFYNNKENKIIIFQLRPSPLGREKILNNIKSEVLYSTNFSWGNYNIGPLKLSDVKNSKNLYLNDFPSNNFLALEVIEKLSSKKNVLIIDPFRGFALSHEKWFLPEKNRHLFGYIYVPYRIILKYVNENICLFSNNNVGIMVKCNVQKSK